MNIVCYINKISGGGAERVMSVLANGLSDRGHTVTMVADYATPNEYPLKAAVERIILDGEFTEATSKGRLLRTIRRISKLRSLCRRKKANVLISFMCESNARAILATRFLKTKNLISVRLDPKVAYSGRSARLVAKYLYPKADGCVFQTPEAKEWFSPKVQKKSAIIWNPIADVFYHTDAQPLTQPRIVTCGRLDRQKRFDLLIDAFDRICDEFSTYQLEIYGAGELAEVLQKQIDRLNRSNRIRLMGRCTDVPETIKDASLFVLSSDYEGLPNALMEAMALGLPVVSTDCGGGGARALIEDGQDGLTVPCGDADALAEAMKKSLANQEASWARGQNAAKKAGSFSVERIIATWEAYITEIV